MGWPVLPSLTEETPVAKGTGPCRQLPLLSGKLRWDLQLIFEWETWVFVSDLNNNSKFRELWSVFLAQVMRL